MILSISRRTDIPAFFSEWFYNRIKEGFLLVRNPMNFHQVSRIELNPTKIECLVFWTKNPSDDFIENLTLLDQKGYKYYFQFTITSYNQKIEANVPLKKEVINKFIKISKLIGKERVIWRYDPIFINEDYNLEYHKKYFKFIAEKLSPYTNKCVFSFLDSYPKIQKRLQTENIRELTFDEMCDMAKYISNICNENNLQGESCCEKINLEEFGINHGHCIDGVLINTINKEKFNFEKDKTQRTECGCITSIDIGTYNTCSHNCIYCYANWNKIKSEKYNMLSPLLCSEIDDKDKITERIIKSCPLLENEFNFGDN